MKFLVTLLVLFPAVMVSSARGADDVGKMLKVTPVEDRPIDDKKDTEDKKNALIPAQPPPTPAPQPGATPEENKNAEPSPSEPESGSIVPEPFPLSRYASLWETSPFQTKSVAPPAQSEELSQRFVLGGILRENGEPVIWVRERATQQSFKVGRSGANGPGPNSRGVSLVEVQEVMTNQSAATAIIRVGEEQGVIKFDAPSGAMPGMAAIPQIPAQTPGGFPGRNPGIPASGAPTSAGGVVPGQIPANVNGRTATGIPSMQPGGGATAVGQPGVVPSVPGPGVPQTQAPSDQQQMPPPRVIRRRAIVPAAPSTP